MGTHRILWSEIRREHRAGSIQGPTLLCYAMHNLSDLQICGHVHDELIIECPEATNVSSITSVMGQSPDWMPNILIRGDGYETKFYKKD